MKFTTLIAAFGGVIFANALKITSPSPNTTLVPVFPETPLKWTWAMGDPETVDIVLQYQFANETAVHSLTLKKNVSATEGNTTVAWTPLGLETGTVCELGLAHVDDDQSTYDHTNEFTLVKAAATTKPAASSSVPLVTSFSVRPIGGYNASTTIFSTLSSTSTLTVITDSGLSTATTLTMTSAVNPSESGLFSSLSSSPTQTQTQTPSVSASVNNVQVTTVYETLSITRTISLTSEDSSASTVTMVTASALSSSGIPVTGTDTGSGGGVTAGVPGTVYVTVTVTETGACSDVTTPTPSSTPISTTTTSTDDLSVPVTSTATTTTITSSAVAGTPPYGTGNITSVGTSGTGSMSIPSSASLTTSTPPTFTPHPAGAQSATTTTGGIYLAALSIMTLIASTVIGGNIGGI